MLNVIINDVALITVKNVDYHCIVHSISKLEAIILLQNCFLEDRWFPEFD